MLKNNKAFTLLETSIALGLLCIIIATSLPITIFIQTERNILTEKRLITYRLHDDLIYLISDGVLDTHKEIIVKNKVVSITQTKENALIKSCATWHNIKQVKEVICLYGWYSPVE